MNCKTQLEINTQIRLQNQIKGFKFWQEHFMFERREAGISVTSNNHACYVDFQRTVAFSCHAFILHQ